MTITDRIKQAEQDGMTITLDPSELSELNEEIKKELDHWIGMYKLTAEHTYKIRRVAMEGHNALRGYNPSSPVADKLARVARGEDV
ncbi:hypothetical protein SLPG_00057 [Salicola phage CGphi29]|uniref:hypothetical protein n=1 Tax=Salicola phage CGphi29 TaxID=754067 RepID=UPI0002C12E1D|nr:hypothetical protein SLPG_00057 [Salicola phage CGphi29]AGH31851.1 hypothetical protein SLPG_00057 [Salicola phage CGphi29]